MMVEIRIGDHTYTNHLEDGKVIVGLTVEVMLLPGGVDFLWTVSIQTEQDTAQDQDQDGQPHATEDCEEDDETESEAVCES